MQTHKALEAEIRLDQQSLQRIDDTDTRLKPLRAALAPGYITGRASVTWQDDWVMAVTYCTHTDGGLMGAEYYLGEGWGCTRGGGKAAISGRLSSPLLPISAVSYSELTETLSASIWKDKTAVSLPNGRKQERWTSTKLPHVHCEKTLRRLRSKT